ncbi:NAD(P)/FAD-dependent oxidoreductase [Hyphomicrobium sp. MC1]|uniref:phytoene desaturase family protein n=1 Tax=Hyphomicrobium sp. (strain MC1) TaxID=717785 RepID=UPI000213ED9F|nr:NAD(P)/FAD-dependent oxidoreductase [Hyphomicrobium sp. MC1]CCB66655.1 putative FAD dependent oxidoreductase [Hyphomicrobium sp. MC1]
MPNPLDIAVIGGGHNGLVTAAYLARKGLSVGVFEARPVVGGAAVTEEFYPGFRNSVCSYLAGLLSPLVVSELGLRQAGLQIVQRPASDFLPLPDGRYLMNTGDSNSYVRQLDALCPGDGAGYKAIDRDLSEVVGAVRTIMDRTPPNIGGSTPSLLSAIGAALEARSLSSHGQMVLMRLLTMSAADFLGHYFQGEAIKGGYGWLSAVGNFQPPTAPGSAYVVLHHSFGESNSKQGTWGHAIGGMGAISDAIAKVARAAGVKIETGVRVAQVNTRGGVASGITLTDGREIKAKRVVANVNPQLLYERLVDRTLLPDEVRSWIGSYQNHSATLRINVALSELPDFTCCPGKTQGIHHGGSVLISPSLSYLEEAYDDAKKGAWARKPAVEMWISSTVDKTLAPEGKHVASLFCQHFNKNLSDGRDWDSCREEAADAAIRVVNDAAPNFAKSIIGRKVLTPTDLEREFGLTGGDIFHGALHLDQIFSMRPVPRYADYRTPIPGLYLCGSGAHPGGGVTGIPGRNAAREIMKDIRSWRPRAPGR